MQRVSFFRLTAGSSSVLDGEETGCRDCDKSYYTALCDCSAHGLVAVAALGSTQAPPLPLCVFDVVKTPYLL